MKLHFTTTGEGPVVVILHGMFGASGNWQTFAKQLAAEGYRVVLPDLRNHGRSPHDAVHTYEALASDVLELVDVEGWKEITLLGHSMGGKTAMCAALEYPDKVGALVVVDIAPRAYRTGHDAIVEALQSFDPSAVANRREADEALAKDIAAPGVRQFLLKNLTRKDEGGFQWKFNLPVIAAAQEDMAAAVTGPPFGKPALFIRGEKSRYVTQDDETVIRRLFPQATVKTAPGAGHWVHVDAPKWLLETTLDFLKRPDEP